MLLLPLLVALSVVVVDDDGDGASIIPFSTEDLVESSDPSSFVLSLSRFRDRPIEYR